MAQHWYLYVIAVTALGYAFIKYSQRNEKPMAEPKKQLPSLNKNMTLDQLRNYGPENERVLLALRGIIYDVSTSEFYCKNGPYSVFSGYDASVNLARMSHDKQLLNKYWVQKLEQDEENVLNDWVSRFELKYPVVGQVIVEKPKEN